EPCAWTVAQNLCALQSETAKAPSPLRSAGALHRLTAMRSSRSSERISAADSNRHCCIMQAVNGRRFPEGGIPGTRRLARWIACALTCTYLLSSVSIHAAQPIDLNDPIGSFTNIASRLLQSELGVDLNRIQIYPTNLYTPSVHRLLQVA